MGLTFTGPLSGFVTQHWSYQLCFAAAAISAVFGIPLVLLIDEARSHNNELAGSERRRTAIALRDAIKAPGLWALFAFIFYLIFTPGENTARFYYSVDVLHLSKQTLGNLGIPRAAGALVGMLGFFIISRRLPVRALVWGAFAMDAAAYIVSFALRDEPTAYVVAFALSLTAIIYSLCLIALAARACPPNLEASIYGLLIGAISFAGSLSEKMGTAIYDAFGTGAGNTVQRGWFALLTAGFLTTLLAPLLIPWLPEWAKSRDPLHSVPP
jgi:Na+/melibiose symporter-like transporter